MISKLKQRLAHLISQKKKEICKRYSFQQAGLSDLFERVIRDRSDEATRNSALRKEQALEDHFLLEYRRLEDAQQRLDAGEFGVCQICREPISISRLFSIPESSLCLNCAKSNERRPTFQNHVNWGQEDAR
jgi:DnaK suppressor protein